MNVALFPALPWRRPVPVRNLAEAIRALPYAAFTLVVATVLVCGAGIATMHLRTTGTPDSMAVAGDPLQKTTGATPAAAVARPRARCDSCGVVESIRALEPAGKLPAAFEFTVRLRDGSLRVSRTVGRGTWRAGDRIMLMGGTGPSGS